MVTSIQPY